MWCTKCNHELGECTCPDLQERLGRVAQNPHIIFRKCLICGKHYSQCKCPEPAWGLSNQPNLPKEEL